MHGHPHRITTRPAMVTTGVILVVAALGTAPIAAQSPGSSAPSVSSAAPSVGTDAASLAWTRSRQTFRRDFFHDLAVGADGTVLAVGWHSDPDRAGKTGCCMSMPAVWSSQAGTHWSRLTTGLPNSVELLSTLATDEGFLVAGLDNDTGTGVLLSVTGTTITRLDAPDGELMTIDRSPAGLHALGMIDAGAVVSTSPDGGTTWTAVTLTETGVVRDLAVTDDGTLVAIGWEPQGEDANAPTAWSSTDGGTTWTATTLPITPMAWVADDIERTPVGLIARVSNGPYATSEEWLSPDGRAWQPVLATAGYPSVGSYGHDALMFGEHDLWVSADGIAWTDLPTPFDGTEIAAAGVLPDGRSVVAGTRYGDPPVGAVYIGAPTTP